MVFLDAGASWLKARGQVEAMRGIESLAATRSVISHRLSTIRRAARIYVPEAGRVVRQGAFDELYAVRGVFRELAQQLMS